jgi:ABC-type transport system substrate-binding protein
VLVKESGYDGRPVVVLHVTDIPFLNAAAIVTRQRLESIGFKVILKAMDFSTNLVVRARKEPPDRGGWNLLHTWWQAADVSNPAVHFGLSGAGPRAWFGWPDIPQIEKLVTDWVRATDQTKRKQLADEVQKVALDEVAYVPWLPDARIVFGGEVSFSPILPRPSHSITSSARASRVGGTSRPSALAVFRLIKSSNRVGCSTGRSAGLAPFRSLCT